MRTESPPPPTTPPDPYRWTVLGIAIIGSLMVSLDSTIVNVALPQIAKDLGSGSGIEWVVTAYLIGVAMAQPASGWLVDRFGGRRVFLTALGAFAATSLLAALAPTLPLLIAARWLQGVAGGCVIPVSMIIVFDVFAPSERGRTIGLWGLANLAAPALGPVVGGYLVTSFSWHWLFLINVPIGALGAVLGVKRLRESPHPGRAGRLDVMGFVLGSAGLALFLLGVSEGNSWGWSSPQTLATVGLGLTALAIFVRHELATPEPMLALRTFSIRGFRLASIITAMLVASQFIRVVYVPSELEVFRNFTALRVGVLLTPAAITSGIAMQFGGRMVDRFGPRVPVTIGSFLVAAGTFALSRFTLTTSGLEIALLLCVQGIGFGLAIVPTTVATVNSVRPALLGQATAIRAVTQQVASAVAVAAAGALISVLTPVHPTPAEAQHAFNLMYAIAATLGAFAFVSAFGLARRPGSTAEPVLFTE